MDLLKIGITGAEGFIGRNLTEMLSDRKDIITIKCPKDAFLSATKLRNFVSCCDVIVHLAAISRHADAQLMYDTNIELVRKLIAAMEAEEVTPQVLFASTTHEAKDTLYHKSKRDGRKLFDDWAERSGGMHTCLLMPNSFGPYGKPNYNSVVSTFCWKVAHGETPEIIADAPVQLIYVKELCCKILRACMGEITENTYTLPHQYEVKVSAILELLQRFKAGYVPAAEPSFEHDLYETYQSYSGC